MIRVAKAKEPKNRPSLLPCRELSEIRKALYKVKEMAESFRTMDAAKDCGRELSLLITETQSARHWGGECLSHYPTGYRVTDNPNDPGSESKGAKE